MKDLATLLRFFAYSDWANAAVLAAAATLTDEQLDREIDIGPRPGSLRRILVHTFNGESTWLERWHNRSEPKWPSEAVKPTIAELSAEFARVARERETFLATLKPGALDVVQPYRDSKGNKFKATLGDMLIQGINHSIHHRAQAVNAIRRLGGPGVELDYMGHVRVPAE